MRLHATAARLLAATIVLLAAYLLPSLAHAHEGHGMGMAVAEGVARSMAPAHSAAHEPSASRIVLGSAEQPAPPMPGSPCHRDCCNPGMICCISAPAAEPALTLPLATGRRQVPLRAMIMPPGRVPEALPKPPRALA